MHLSRLFKCTPRHILGVHTNARAISVGSKGKDPCCSLRTHWVKRTMKDENQQCLQPRVRGFLSGDEITKRDRQREKWQDPGLGMAGSAYSPALCPKPSRDTGKAPLLSPRPMSNAADCNRRTCRDGFPQETSTQETIQAPP